MLTKNQTYEAIITDYTSEGQGVAHIEGCAVFIPNAIAGEKCLVRIEKAAANWAAGKIVEILERSPHRVNRQCPVAKLCGGCDFWHMDYEEESRLKAERVRNCLNRIGGENLEAVPILAANDCFGYRNKAQYPVSSHKNKVYAGFFRAGTHQVVENKRCLILPRETDAVKDAVIDYVNQYRITAYDEVAHKGLLRHIYVRRGAVSGQILVCLVVNGRSLPHIPELIARLKKIKGFTTLVLSVNTKKGNAVLGDEFITLHGPGYIEDTLCGLSFRLSPRSFYQVNHDQAEKLYRAAIDQAGITKNDTVLDLYCGVGTITLAMAGTAGKVIGVEVIPQAVADARDNAKRNGIENAQFFCGDAGQAALELEKQGIQADVVVVDPPRKGLNADTIEALHRFAPRRIVYVSCDPATLARDVALLKQRGYAVQNAQAADLFPRCSHVESIVCLSRKTTHEMKLHAAPFEKIKSGVKNIELRLFDEKRKKIKAGDDIIFTNTVNGEKMCATVKKIHLFGSFEELYKTLPLLQCGYTAKDIDTARPSDMEQYYSVDEQEKYGVVGIELFPPRQITDESIVCLSREEANRPNPNFRMAQQSDAEHVLSLYQSAISGEFCVWNNSYPSITEIERDLETKNLYVMTDGGKIIGAISVVPENELDGFVCWSCKDGKEIARVVIDKDCQGHGLSYQMVQSIESILRENGYKAIHLSVAKSNIPAYKTYMKAGFTVVGEAQMYGNDYYLMEKAIDTTSLPKRITDESIVCLCRQNP